MRASRVAFCTVDNEQKAYDIVLALKGRGFIGEEISALMPNHAATTTFAHEAHTKAPEGASIGGSVGGVAGGVLGLLVGTGTLAIPGLGPLLAAGPLLATLSGIAFGGTIGGLAGALAGLGMTEVEAKLYERRLNEGKIVITADCGESDARVQAAYDVFKENDAEDITSMKPATKREKSDRLNPPTPPPV